MISGREIGKGRFDLDKKKPDYLARLF